MITNAQSFRSFFDDNPSLTSKMKDVVFHVDQSSKKQTPFDFFNEPPKLKPNEANKHNQDKLDENGNPILENELINQKESNVSPKELPRPNSLLPEDNIQEWQALYQAFKDSMTYLVFTEPNFLIKNGITSAITGENAEKITEKILSNPETFKSFLETSNELIATVKEKMDFQEDARLNNARNLEEHINQMDAILETKNFGFNPAKRAKFLVQYESALEAQKDSSASLLPTNPLTLAKPY